MEFDHRDLIPPWGHGLFPGEAEKPTMPVWLDRNGGALPSRWTTMVGRGNCTMTVHGRRIFGSRQPIQQAFWQYAAEEAGVAAQSSLAPGSSWAKPCAWMQGFRAKLSPDSDLIRASAGEDWLYSGAKEGIQAKNGGIGGRVRGKRPLFSYSKADLGGIW